ncbi:Pho89 protein [Martiniozyma asiatica (nom. inval.)]|nr:Pho89 protein [Martiniozyma asiatica]
MQLAQFDYLFAIAIIFAFLDAFNIGANDVSNSFSSSVASRSLTYFQAMILAAIFEFLGATLAGSRVSGTIKNNIVDLKAFQNDNGGTPAVLMLTMTCALVGSSIWCSIATYYCMPVSSTHSIIGAVIGAGIAAVGSKNIIWGWSGFSQIIASWFIAPLLGGVISSIIFLFSKYLILETKKPIKNALIVVPFVVFATFAILTMLIVWKGAPNLGLADLSDGAVIGSIFGVGGVASIIYMIFIHPIFYRRLIHKDWTIPNWHALFGFVYYFKSTDNIPPIPKGKRLVVDYYGGKVQTDEQNFDIESITESDPKAVGVVIEKPIESEINLNSNEQTNQENVDESLEQLELTAENIRWNNTVSPKEYTVWKDIFLNHPSKYPLLLWLMLSHGFRHDVISNQVKGSDIGPSVLGNNVENIHQHCKVYPNEVEHMFSFLQCITACTMSFAHGSNDIANAAGPLSSVYTVWTTNLIGSKSDVPIWVLCFTAGSLVVGIWMFGYRIMGILGNKLTLQSPCRGFSIELGCAVTVVMATRLSIPVSTTQIAIGSTVFVGLCNGNWRATNWRIVFWSYGGWFLTLPMAGIVSGVICGIILNAPRWGGDYQLV